MSKKVKILIIGLAVLLGIELIVAGCILFYIKPWQKAKNTMIETGSMTLVQESTGELVLSWPEGVNHDRYRVRVASAGELLMQIWVREESCILENLPEGEDLDITISSARGYYFPMMKDERVRLGQTSLRATVDLTPPTAMGLTGTPDPDTNTVNVQFEMIGDSVCRMYQVDRFGGLTELHSLEEGQITLQLGEEGDFPVPEKDESLTFAFDVYRFSPGIVYYGTAAQTLTIVREDMLGRELALEHTDLGNNVHSFTWAETKGEYYELQLFNDETQNWDVVKRVELDEERSYTTKHLEKHKNYLYRVVAVGGQIMPESDFAAVSQEADINTTATAVYCTVWPIQTLKMYKDVSKTESIGSAKAATAVCVIDEQDGMFRVRINGQEGYIDSNYCLINLTEYLGDLCVYDITNSDKSSFMVHEYEIPGITGRVLPGYERVQLRRGQQLVPLLYPTAKKLEKAAQAAISQGCKLKIYDAYRPMKASTSLYIQTISLMNQVLPRDTFTGKYLTDLPVLAAGQQLGYGDLMTNFGKISVDKILEEGKSVHNQGIALDVTLVESTTEMELQMQTSVHDLSWYAGVAYNNDNSKKLATIMKAAGFEILSSEWWHFQDSEAQKTLKPEYQNEGVLPDCWMVDDRGWRYRRDDGEYYKDCTQIIGTYTCTFDKDGYLVTE